MIVKIIYLFAFAFVSTQGGPLFDPCKKDDLKCLSAATDSFMSKTYAGYPQLGVKPTDPLIIPSLIVPVDDALGLEFYFKDLNVTGLKNIKTADFKMNTDNKSVLLKLRADLKVVGDLEIRLTKSQKTFKGVYTASMNVLETSKYSYNIKTINGTDFFDLGPEENSCEITEEPVVSVDADLDNSLGKDKDASSVKNDYDSRKVSLRKKTLCKIANTAFETIISNLRTSARFFPKSYFITDI